jgi:WD40 repeat protein
MGIASSSTSTSTPLSSSPLNNSVGDGELYVQLVNGQRLRPSSSKLNTDSSGKGTENRKLGIHPRARILRRLCYDHLWNVFLSSSFQSFALTPAELQSVLKEASSLTYNDNGDNFNHTSDVTAQKSKLKGDQATIDMEIQDYVGLLQELEPHKMIDFMAIVTSVLLLSNTMLEVKVDQLFAWIALAPGEEVFSIEDFSLALSSFDRGISNGLGRVASSEGFISIHAKSWIALAAPENRNLTTKSISKQNFFDFCTNRQHVVRRLLEALSILDVLENAHMQLNEVDTEAIDSLIDPPKGDEWMANPAWKKTAERMVPMEVKQCFVNAKPTSYLELEWVHGYRGHDCRNNIFYLNSNQVAFPAAGLCIVSDRQVNGNQSQHFFSEHGDDVLSLAVFKQSNSVTILASGEIGKSPAVFLYSWTQNVDSGLFGGNFQTLACLRGCHTKGVTQICFSQDGALLFTVGVDYTVAIYGVDQSNHKTFGKMLSSAQGPKNIPMNAVACNLGSSDEYQFASCGEKHAILWSFDKSSSVLSKQDIKLGTHRNKVFLCAAQCGDNTLIMSSSEGDMLLYSADGVATAAQIQKNSFSGHGSKASINALTQNQNGTLLFSGDREGKVVVWQYSTATKKLTIVWETVLEGYVHARFLEGIDNDSSSRQQNKARSGTTSSDKLKENSPPVRALSISPDGSKLLVGSQRCDIVEYQLPPDLITNKGKVSTAAMVSSQVLTSGHFQGEVWGLAVRPVTVQNAHEGVRYATVADDGYLRLWDLSNHSLLTQVHLRVVARCCDFSPDGMYLAVGFGAGRSSLGTKKAGAKSKDDGMVKVLRFDCDSNNDIVVTQVAEIREAKQWISVVRFSPDGTFLAVGSRDNSIYLYSVPNQFKRKAKFSKHNAGIAQLDFSVCGRFIQSCCR